MLFMNSYRIRPGQRDEAIRRFAKNGGQPPQGVKLVGRWHDAAGGTGFTISETDDASKMAQWALEWNDVMELDVRPALTDEQLGPVLAGMQQR
jgi:hypothetical protein